MEKNKLKVVEEIISQIAIYFVRILFGMIVIGMLFINSVYLYDDSPDFRLNNGLNYLGIFIGLLMLAALAFLTGFLRKKCDKKYINFVLLLLYFLGQIVFLLLVPIQMFSDMAEVTKIALSNFTENMEYLQRCSNNLPIALVFNLIFRLTTYQVWILKVLNCVCNCVTIYFTYRLYENIYGQKNRLVLVWGIFLIPTFLYVNMVYNDIIFAIYHKTSWNYLTNCCNHVLCFKKEIFENGICNFNNFLCFKFWLSVFRKLYDSKI